MKVEMSVVATALHFSTFDCGSLHLLHDGGKRIDDDDPNDAEGYHDLHARRVQGSCGQTIHFMG